MTANLEAAPGTGDDWDRLVAELQAQRERVGNPSYAEIAERIQQDRIGRGAPDYAARVARSTVYDAFRVGRRRVNVALVKEIGHALGAAPEDVQRWIDDRRGPQTPVVNAAPEPTPDLKHVLLLMGACLALNMVGREFVDFFQFPVYLDMVGTAVAALALGPWRGAAVGATTNIVGVIGSGWISLPFALVNVVGALVWGYGVRRWNMGRTLPRFFALNVINALACSLVAVPIIVIFLGDQLRVGHDVITQLVGETIDTLVVAVGFSNILTSTADKLLSGFVALVVITALPAAFHQHLRLVRALRAADTE